jgi:hypothetical protein
MTIFMDNFFNFLGIHVVPRDMLDIVLIPFRL